jgi:sugar/nucleoside kinase (ribokinase family)
MDFIPHPRFVIAGQLRRDFILPPGGDPVIDIPGGGLLAAAAGLSVWESGIGLLARTGSDLPAEWIDDLRRRGLDTQGIHPVAEVSDSRFFCSYSEQGEPQNDNPVSAFAHIGLSFPKSLLGYNYGSATPDNRTRLSPLSIRQADIPSDYLDASAVHLCPLDFLSHNLLPSVLRQGHVTTITIDPGPGYMDPLFWNDLPAILNGLTAFLVSEKDLRSYFQGRSTDLWEMASALAAHGCELIAIKRGIAGQYIYDAGSHLRWSVPAYPGRVVDPTGAGDAYCGGFLAGWRRSYDPLQAALQGNISASLVIESSQPFYASDTLPGLAEARLQALQEMVRPV